MSVETSHYFERFGYCAPSIEAAPDPDLGMVVVIPCHREPDLIASLESLRAADRPRAAVEIVVVVNAAQGCAPEVQAMNQATVREVETWQREHWDPRFRVHLLVFDQLPPKQAGVGLARKIGMDEAVSRLGKAGRPRGAIVCFDADCVCEANYFRSLEAHFERHPETPGCGIYFEHPLEGPLDARVYRAIADYELHLRYYVQGLRWASFPFAHHTVGSAMAVRADVYCKQGGMNRRQAGEDFYFLQKIMAMGGFTDLTATRVIPSPRPSDRVPFGTGRAVRAVLDGERFRTYPFQAFADLKRFLRPVGSLTPASLGEMRGAASEAMRAFLDAREFGAACQEIVGNTASPGALRKRFFQWFNGFMAMKFIHHARDHFYGEGDLSADPGRLWEALMGENALEGVKAMEDFDRVPGLLRLYRKWERGAGGGPLTTDH